MCVFGCFTFPKSFKQFYKVPRRQIRRLTGYTCSFASAPPSSSSSLSDQLSEKKTRKKGSRIRDGEGVGQVHLGAGVPVLPRVVPVQDHPRTILDTGFPPLGPPSQGERAAAMEGEGRPSPAGSVGCRGRRRSLVAVRPASAVRAALSRHRVSE